MSDMSVRLGSVGTCNVSVSREWDGHGRSVDARTPVDHDSVGLPQARPNYNQIYWAPLHEIHVITLHPYPSTEDQT